MRLLSRMFQDVKGRAQLCGAEMPVLSASSCGTPATPLERNDSGSSSPRSTLGSHDFSRGTHHASVAAKEAPGNVPRITQSITIKRIRQEPSPTVQHSPTSRSAPAISGNWSFAGMRQPAEPRVFDWYNPLAM
ncbi:unnamed protein product [Closterium sp. NIES-54]